MSRFEERKVFGKETCESCKYCHSFEVYYDFVEERAAELFCMLDVSEEDIDYLLDAVPFDYDKEEHPRVLRILNIKEGEELWKGHRMTGSSNCCQFYEGMNKKEESKDA